MALETSIFKSCTPEAEDKQSQPGDGGKEGDPPSKASRCDKTDRWCGQHGEGAGSDICFRECDGTPCAVGDGETGLNRNQQHVAKQSHNECTGSMHRCYGSGRDMGKTGAGPL